MIKDKSLENNILSILGKLEELNDSVAPTNLRHHVSDVVCELRKDIKNFNQDLNEYDANIFNPEIVVANKYIDLFNTQGVSILRNENDPTSHGHLRWMLQEIVDNVYLSKTKKNRWLGYVQGCMVKDGLIDVEKERDNTRNIFNGK